MPQPSTSGMGQVTIRPAGDGEDSTCIAIGKSVPTHFTPHGLDLLRAELPYCMTLLALRGEDPVGFISLRSVNSHAMDIAWMAVLPTHQRRGAGHALMDAAVSQARGKGSRFLVVRTLAASASYEPYEHTRRFYVAMGFSEIAVVDPYPGWDPGNPCSVMVRAL